VGGNLDSVSLEVVDDGEVIVAPRMQGEVFGSAPPLFGLSGTGPDL